MTALLATVKGRSGAASADEGMRAPDAACNWLRNNSNTWTSWFRPTTTRKFVVDLNPKSSAVIYGLLAVYLAASVAAHLFLYVHRKHVVIRRASHLFCQCIIFGANCFYITLLVGIQKDSKAICTASQFLLSISFSLFYVALLVKSYRIYAIFLQQQLQALKLPDSTMFFYLALYAAFDLALVALWAIVDAPSDKLVEHSSTEFAYVRKCTSEVGDVFRGLIYVLRGFALLFGAFLAIRISNTISDDYNESRFIAIITCQWRTHAHMPAHAHTLFFRPTLFPPGTDCCAFFSLSVLLCLLLQTTSSSCVRSSWASVP
jgi:hypothetical protein